MSTPSSVFGSIADDYAAARPGYPTPLFEALRARLSGISSGVARPAGPPRILDVAAGTGAATASLLGSGAEVLAVEPAVPMLVHARDRLEGQPGWAGAVAAQAEALPIVSDGVDAVTIAQAFHWMEEAAALAELARVLRSGGLLAVLWNIAETDAFIRELWQVVEALNPGHKRPVTAEKRQTPDSLVLHPAFVTEPPREFPHVRHIAVDEYVRYALSWSYVGGALGPAGRAVFERELRAIFARHHGSGSREERLVAVAHFARRR